jgi:hypothetical protein
LFSDSDLRYVQGRITNLVKKIRYTKARMAQLGTVIDTLEQILG